jgi:hypothetical protein
MKTFFYYFFVIAIFFSISATSQNVPYYSGLLSQIHGSYTNENLKDSVKTVKFKYSNLKEVYLIRINHVQSLVMIFDAIII